MVVLRRHGGDGGSTTVLCGATMAMAVPRRYHCGWPNPRWHCGSFEHVQSLRGATAKVRVLTVLCVATAINDGTTAIMAVPPRSMPYKHRNGTAPPVTGVLIHCIYFRYAQDSYSVGLQKDSVVLQRERNFPVSDELGIVIYPTGVWLMNMKVPAGAAFFTNYKLVAENDLGTTEHVILMTTGKYTLQIVLSCLVLLRLPCLLQAITTFPSLHVSQFLTHVILL